MDTTHVYDHNNGWGSGAAAGVGGFIGSAFGNGGFGFGNRGGYAAENTLLDAINTNRVSSDIQGVSAGITTLQNSTNQGFAGVNATVNTTSSAIQNSTNQGFAGLQTSILTTGKDAQLASCQSTGAIVSAIKDCCCATQTAIREEACATRELINQNYLRGVETALCDAKAKNASLEATLANIAVNEKQTSTILHHLGALASQFGGK